MATPQAAVFLRSAEDSPSLPGPLESTPHAVSQPGGRKRLWEVSPVHHCVLLGAAFDARDLRQVLRRAGYSGWETSTDYELHSSAVSLAAQSCEFSRRAQRKLDERYEAAICAFRSCASGRELLSRWHDCAGRGEPVAAYWAAITHRACDAHASEALSREMHMLAHTAFIANRAAVRRIRALQEASSAWESALQASQARLRQARTEVGRLRADVQAAQRELSQSRAATADAAAALERRQSGLEAAEWQARCHATDRAHAAVLAELAATQRALARVNAQVERSQQSARRAVPERTIGTASAVSMESASCASDECALVPDLTDACVLCVGGKASLVPQYRALVERAKGGFLYHDGGIEDHLGRLPALLSSATAVVCFSSEVSHAAYRTVKRYCRVRGKPCALIQQPSVSAAARALATLRGQLPDKKARVRSSDS